MLIKFSQRRISRKLTLVVSLLVLPVFGRTTDPENRDKHTRENQTYTCKYAHADTQTCLHTCLPATVMGLLGPLAKEEVPLALRV